MSILSGYKKVKNYIETGSGKKLLSRWTSSNTVEFNDGKTAQTKVGTIKGITTSTSATETGYAADATTVAALNQSLGNITYKKYNNSIDLKKYTSNNKYTIPSNGIIKLSVGYTKGEYAKTSICNPDGSYIMDVGISYGAISNVNSVIVPVFKGMKIANDLSAIGRESISFYSYSI